MTSGLRIAIGSCISLFVFFCVGGGGGGCSSDDDECVHVTLVSPGRSKTKHTKKATTKQTPPPPPTPARGEVGGQGVHARAVLAAEHRFLGSKNGERAEAGAKHRLHGDEEERALAVCCLIFLVVCGVMCVGVGVLCAAAAAVSPPTNCAARLHKQTHRPCTPARPSSSGRR